MGSFISSILSSTQSSQAKLNQVVDYCDREVPQLKNIAQMIKNSNSLENTKILYLKSLEYIKCDNSNSKLLKSQIFNLYQDLIIDKALEILDKLKEWKIAERNSNKESENDEIQLKSLQERIKELTERIDDVSKITKDYIRKDKQASDILNIIRKLLHNANEQLKVVSEAAEVYKARYLFGIIIANITAGSVEASNMITDIKQYLTVESYKGCMMFSEFIPLLYPTNNEDWGLNNSTSFSITDDNIKEYLQIGDDGLISEDCETAKCLLNLTKYYSNYFWPKYGISKTVFRNCEFNPQYGKNNDTFNYYSELVKPFVSNENIRSWGNFFKYGRQVLDKIECHHIKMLPFMAKKMNNAAGSTEFMKIPITWPKYNKDIELTEAIIAVANICFANCGGEKDTNYNNNLSTDTNNLIEADINENDNKNKTETNKTKIQSQLTHIKNYGGLTYCDIGLYNKNNMYFDKRAFILVKKDGEKGGIFEEVENKVYDYVKASELENLSKEVWKDYKIILTGNPEDLNKKDSVMNMLSDDDQAKKIRKCIYNNTGYFTDKIYNCTDITQFTKGNEYPIIPNLSVFKLKTTGIDVLKNGQLDKTLNEMKTGETFKNISISQKRYEIEQAIGDSVDVLTDNEINNIYSKLMIEKYKKERFELTSNIISSTNEFTITYSGITNKYIVNDIVKELYNYIIKNKILDNLYESKNNALFSSIEYMTCDKNGYSINPLITLNIYETLIVNSLKFELLIPINTNLTTNMSICTNDIINGCDEKYLIPFAFSCKKDNSNKYVDDLFNISDVESVKKVSDFKVEGETFEEEKFIDKVINYFK